MSDFECGKCGEVDPKEILDSCPAQGQCPKCGLWLTSKRGITLLTEEEGRKLRPELYKIHDKKLKDRKDKEKKKCSNLLDG